jgi:gluconolactonase
MRGLLWTAVLAAPLWAQNFAEYHVVRAAVGYTFTEGPAWSRDGFLLFSDVPNNKIWRFTPGEKPVLFRDQSNGANGNTFDAKGRLYTCESRTRRVTRTDRKGAIEVLAEKWEDKRLNAPNDIVVRKDGNVYFTDPAFGQQADTRELDFYGVYQITPKGELRLIAKPQGRPNGIGLSPDGRTLYVANSDERNLRAYDVDRGGNVANERVLISGIDGPPDGIAIDEKGNIYVTANKLPVYSPDGKLLHTIEVAEKPANCAFGDADLGTLFITARTSVFAVRLGVKGALQY